MPVLYEPYQSVLPNKQGKRLYHPRVVRVGTVNTDQIAREIAEYSSLSPGDVKNTLENLVTVMSRHLQSSQSVTLDNLGTFRLVMNSQGKGVEKAEEVNASQAVLRIRFQPASTRNIDGTTATRSMVTGAKCRRYDSLTGNLGDVEEPTEPDTPGSGDGEEEL